MGRLRSFITSVSFTVTAAVTWGAAEWAHWGEDARAMMRSAAVAVTILAAMCWVRRQARVRSDRRYADLADEYKRREAVLIRTISRLGGSPTGPMPRLHVVQAQVSVQRRRP
jgi:hypothetical protein